MLLILDPKGNIRRTLTEGFEITTLLSTQKGAGISKPCKNRVYSSRSNIFFPLNKFKIESNYLLENGSFHKNHFSCAYTGRHVKIFPCFITKTKQFTRFWSLFCVNSNMKLISCFKKNMQTVVRDNLI